MTKTNALGEEALRRHKELRGKLDIAPKVQIRDMHDLSVFYTPGMGAVSSYLAEHPEEMADYTIRSGMVGVISDGSAVLGLGNIGPAGALPVMEGKAILFRQLGGINAFPIVLDTQDEAAVIDAIAHIAPVFAGINLEDIAAPKCFAIERALRARLDIPVIHDDQHATAIVVVAGLINALKVVGKDRAAVRIVMTGAGAAGNGVAHLLHDWGVGDIVVLDSRGILNRDREELDAEKQALVEITNKDNMSGDLTTAMHGADIFLGLSQPGILTVDHVRSMVQQPIVFAMANPTPEIMPDEANAAGVAVMATGRCDFPNQINNVLVFPGMFRGAIDNHVRDITSSMKLAAAKALAATVPAPTADRIIPTVFDKAVVPAIAGAIK